MRTRYEERKKKRRQNFILNVLIGIVFICIVVVVLQIIFDSPSQTEPTQAQSSENDKQNENASEKKEEQENLNNEVEDSDHSHSHDAESTDGYTFVDGGPSGPWQPIGTKQTGEHVTTFEKDSLDWQEMEMALAYGAGIDRNNMTVLWIGNGGDPQRAQGKIKSKDDPNTIYHVLIEWVDEKGWKPIEVTIEQ